MLEHIEWVAGGSSATFVANSSDDCDQKGVTSVDATLHKESLQIGCIDEFEVAVINVSIEGIKIEIISCCQVLLEHLCLPSKCQLLLEELCQAALNIIW